MKKINIVHKLITLALPLLLLAGCGSGSPAPVGSSIAITPDKIDYTGPALLACAGNWSYDPVTITVISPNGRPAQYVDVSYTLSWTLNTSTYDIQRLYLGPPTGTNPPPIQLLGTGTAQTDISGRLELIVATDIDCVHTTNLSVQSGGAYGLMTIDVQ
jgi:hypothetical protein